MVVEDLAFKTNQVFDNRYVLKEKLGEGAWKKVFLALDQELNREVALNILKQETDDSMRSQSSESPLELFLQEPNIIARIMEDNRLHPENLKYFFQVYDKGQDKETDHHYFSSEYVDSRLTLKKLLEEHLRARYLFDPREIVKDNALRKMIKKQSENIKIRGMLDIVTKIANGLTIAAKSKVRHNDPNPGNIILYEESESTGVKILDFSSTHSISFQSNRSSLLFRPPEEFIDNTFTESSAVWAFGILMYRCFTTQYPFYSHFKKRDHQREDLRKIVTNFKKEIVSPRKINPNISRALDYIITKCLNKDPKSRYSCIEHVRDDLLYRVRSKPRMKKRSLITLIAVPLALLAGHYAKDHLPLSEKIVYQQKRDLYSMDLEGKKAIKINKDINVREVITSDKGMIFFTNQNPAKREIYSMRANGSLLKRLTNTKDIAEENLYLSKGRIIFSNAAQDRLFAINVDGSEQMELKRGKLYNNIHFKKNGDVEVDGTTVYTTNNGLIQPIPKLPITTDEGYAEIYDHSADRTKRVMLKNNCIIFEDTDEKIKRYFPRDNLKNVLYCPATK